MDCIDCPAPATLTDIVAEACGIDLKQIQRTAYQRYQTEPPFTATTILTLATWQEYLTAEDDTKIVVAPKIGGDPIIEAGEKITSGGNDNSTINGVEELEGVGPSNFSAVYKSLTPAQEKAIKALMCEKDGLTVYLFLQGGRIASVNVTLPTAGNRGFEITGFFLSDRNNAGYGTRDTFNTSFSFPAGWSEGLSVVKPNFNPLTDL